MAFDDRPSVKAPSKDRFDGMKRLNASVALYAWWISGGILIGAHGAAAFFSVAALAYFVVGSYAAIYVIGTANFLLQRGAAKLLQAAFVRPTPFAVRFINGFGLGLLSSAAALAWFAASFATTILFPPL